MDLNPYRFRWVFDHADDAPPTEEKLPPYSPVWLELLDEADRLSAALGSRYLPDQPMPPGPGPGLSDETLLFSGSGTWAVSGVRSLLQKYLDESGNPDDPEAILMQGILIGGFLFQGAGYSALFRRFAGNG